MIRVLGLDLSLTAAGVAGIGWAETLKYPVRAPTPMTADYRHRRIAWLRVSLADRWLAGTQLAVLEGLAYDAHDTDRQNAGLSWIIRQTLWQNGVPYALVPPSCLKQYATGKGAGPAADKASVTAAVRSYWPKFDGDDNAADAAVLAAMGAHHLGWPLWPVPKTQAAVLANITWPEVPALEVIT